MAYADNTTGGRVIVAGVLPVKITLAEACEVGDLLGYSTGWKRALATTPTCIEARLVAGSRGQTGDVINAYGLAAIEGVSGATVGSAVYAAEAALYGETTQTQPNTSGDVDNPIGFAYSATGIWLFPGVTPAYSDADHRAT